MGRVKVVNVCVRRSGVRQNLSRMTVEVCIPQVLEILVVDRTTIEYKLNVRES